MPEAPERVRVEQGMSEGATGQGKAAPLPRGRSEGWGGDRYTVVKRKDGTLLAYLATTWDTEDDAKQFAAAYEASLAKRFPNKDRKTKVLLDGKRVFILDGDDDAKLFAQLIKQTKFS